MEYLDLILAALSFLFAFPLVVVDFTYRDQVADLIFCGFDFNINSSTSLLLPT